MGEPATGAVPACACVRVYAYLRRCEYCVVHLEKMCITDASLGGRVQEAGTMQEHASKMRGPLSSRIV